MTIFSQLSPILIPKSKSTDTFYIRSMLTEIAFHHLFGAKQWQKKSYKDTCHHLWHYCKSLWQMFYNKTCWKLLLACSMFSYRGTLDIHRIQFLSTWNFCFFFIIIIYTTQSKALNPDEFVISILKNKRNISCDYAFYLRNKTLWKRRKKTDTNKYKMS